MLNLIKSAEKRPRESILQSELANAISYINKGVRHPPCLYWPPEHPQMDALPPSRQSGLRCELLWSSKTF